MCCSTDLSDRWYFVAAVDALHWYVHRNDKKRGNEENKPPPGPPVWNEMEGRWEYPK